MSDSKKSKATITPSFGRDTVTVKLPRAMFLTFTNNGAAHPIGKLTIDLKKMADQTMGESQSMLTRIISQGMRTIIVNSYNEKPNLQTSEHCNAVISGMYDGKMPGSRGGGVPVDFATFCLTRDGLLRVAHDGMNAANTKKIGDSAGKAWDVKNADSVKEFIHGILTSARPQWIAVVSDARKRHEALLQREPVEINVDGGLF